MINPVTEVRAFVDAALFRPVPRDHQQSDAAFRWRRICAAVTLLIGAALLGWSLQLPPGDPRFYWGTFALAAAWAVGAVASGPLHLGRGWTRRGFAQQEGANVPVVQALVLGLLLLGLFLAGAVVVAQIPFLRRPVEELLDHASVGSFWLVLVITAVNGIAEELYFRGALFAAIGRRHPVAISTIVYTLVTATSLIPLLTLAGALLGLVTGLQRRVTGGILAPTITHLTWSIGMLFLLQPTLDAFG